MLESCKKFVKNHPGFTLSVIGGLLVIAIGNEIRYEYVMDYYRDILKLNKDALTNMLK